MRRRRVVMGRGRAGFVRFLALSGFLVMGWVVGCEAPQGPCTADTDCTNTETCTEGKCVPKETAGCTQDSDCSAAQVCQEKKCVAKPKPQSCTDSSCGSGEVCFQKQRCVKTPTACKSNGECGTEGLCVGEDGSTVCKTRCDGTTANPDKTHASCWDGWGHCEPLSAASPERGVCVPPRGASQKSGEDCQSDDYAKPSYDDCAEGLRCVAGTCLPNCDPTKGSATNLICPAGTYCKGEKTSGLCEKLPAAKTGPKQMDELCSNLSAANFCDGQKGLTCADRYCTKACDPRKGAENNPICGKEATCIEDAENSYLGGQCAAKPTQKKGEPCSQARRLFCIAGLNCSNGSCAPACDPKKTGECGTGEVCNSFGNVCVTSCDPTKGGTANPTCPVGSYCLQSRSAPPGYCRSLPTFDEGTVGLGDVCSLGDDKNCDGKKKLFCYRSQCMQACDLRKGKDKNPDCAADHECTETIQSPLGGLCLPNPTQKETEPCAEVADRCLDGLRCSTSRCARTCDGSKPQPSDCKAEEWCVASSCRPKCDPANGVVGNSACPAGYYCNESANLYKPGYCRTLPLQPTGPIKLGEKCSSITAAEQCDGKAGLTCRLGLCATACDPSKGEANNADCATGQTCETQLQSSFLGGVCVTEPTQKELELCNTTDKLCLDGLICNEVDGSSYCFKTCNPAMPDTCPANTTCQPGSSGRRVCLPTRSNTGKLYDKCKGAPGSPDFDDCGVDLLCVKLLDGTERYCLPACAPPKTCVDNTICAAGTSGLRVCVQTCQSDADCTDYGTACKERGQEKICR